MDPGVVALELGRIGLAAQALLVRGRRYPQEELVETEGDDPVRQPAGPHYPRQHLGGGQGLRRGGHPPEAGQGGVGVRGQDVAEVAQLPVLLLAPPGRVGGFQPDLADQLVEDQFQQFLAAGDVRVQRGRAGAEPVGDPAHGQPGVAGFVQDLDRRGHDHRDGQRRLPPGGGTAPGHPRRGRRERGLAARCARAGTPRVRQWFLLT